VKRRAQLIGANLVNWYLILREVHIRENQSFLEWEPDGLALVQYELHPANTLAAAVGRQTKHTPYRRVAHVEVAIA